MTLPAGLALLLAAYLALATSLLGWRTPAYRASRDSLSHLGEVGRQYAACTNYGVFLPVGLGCLWLAWQTSASLPQLMLSLSLAVGYLGAALWPLRAQPHPANHWHYLAGAIEYIGGIVALAWAGATSSAAAPGYLALSGLVLLAITLSLLPSMKNHAGQWQRLAEASLFIGQYLLLSARV